MTSFFPKKLSMICKHDVTKTPISYTLSKKVAELTQVIHILFTKNHKQEVELDALRVCYKDEIERIIQQAQSEKTSFEIELFETTKQRQQETFEKLDETTQLLKETQARMETLKQHLSKEQNQKRKIQDLLSEANLKLKAEKFSTEKVVETLEQTNLLLVQKQDEMAEQKKAYKKLQEHFKEKEGINKDSFGTQESKINSEKQLAEAQAVIRNLVKSLDENNRQIDELSLKLQQNEEELQTAKQEAKRNVYLAQKYYSNKGELSLLPLQKHDHRKNSELETLRREIVRLRMELGNREENFNRVFAKFRPVVTWQRSNSPGVQKNKMMMVTPHTSEVDIARKNQRRTDYLNSSRTQSEFVMRNNSGNTDLSEHQYCTITSKSRLVEKLHLTKADSRKPITNKFRVSSSCPFRLVYAK